MKSKIGEGSCFSFFIRVDDWREVRAEKKVLRALANTVLAPPIAYTEPLIHDVAIRPLLDQLDALLASNMLDAQILAAEIEGLLTTAGQAELFGAVSSAVQELRFTEARENLAKIQTYVCD